MQDEKGTHLFDWEMGNASLFCPLYPSLSIKIIKASLLLILVFDLFHLCPARCHLC